MDRLLVSTWLSMRFVSSLTVVCPTSAYWRRHADVPFDVLVGSGPSEGRVDGCFSAEQHPHRHAHGGQQFESWVYRRDGPFDLWGDRRPSTELVVIATSGQNDRPQVEALLDAGMITV